MDELRATCMEVMEPLLANESGKILHELIENQLRGVEKFYELRVTETNEMPLIGETGFDLITDKYRAIVRIFVTAQVQAEVAG